MVWEGSGFRVSLKVKLSFLPKAVKSHKATIFWATPRPEETKAASKFRSSIICKKGSKASFAYTFKIHQKKIEKNGPIFEYSSKINKNLSVFSEFFRNLNFGSTLYKISKRYL